MKRGFAAAACVIAADQLSKQAVLNFFGTRAEDLKITDFFNLVLRLNRGISF